MSGPIHCKVLEVGDLDGDGKLAGVVLTMAREDVRRFGAHLYADIVIAIDEDDVIERAFGGGDVGGPGHRAAVEDAKAAQTPRPKPAVSDGTSVAEIAEQAVRLLEFDKSRSLAAGEFQQALDVPKWKWTRVVEILRTHPNVARTGENKSTRYQYRSAP